MKTLIASTCQWCLKEILKLLPEIYFQRSFQTQDDDLVPRKAVLSRSFLPKGLPFIPWSSSNPDNIQVPHILPFILFMPFFKKESYFLSDHANISPFPYLSMEQEREDTLSSFTLSWGNQSNNISFSIFWYSSANYPRFLNNVHWHMDTTISIWKESQCFILPLVFQEVLREIVTKRK